MLVLLNCQAQGPTPGPTQGPTQGQGQDKVSFLFKITNVKVLGQSPKVKFKL